MLESKGYQQSEREPMKLCPGHERLSSDYSDWKCGAQCRFCQGTCQKCFPPEPATPTPSITVGTQVRLTGVVRDCNDSVAAVAIGGMAGDNNTIAWVMLDQIEVIRQPFKRGEVVWSCGAVATGIAYQVLGDETDLGDVLLIKEGTEGGNKSFVAHHSDFERRPSRPKEER